MPSLANALAAPTATGDEKYRIEHGPSFATLRARIDPGETLTAEAGVMVSRAPHVRMHTRLNSDPQAGFFGRFVALLIALVRKVLGGETLFINDFSAEGTTGELVLAPKLSGMIHHRRLDGDRILLWGGAFLACTSGIRLRVRWGGLRGLLSRAGLFYVEASGSGDLFFNAYGGIETLEVRGGYVVDTGHIVAFDGELDFEISTPGGGLLGLAASSEGLVCKFKGHGRVYVQSRNLSALVGWITPYLPG